MWIDLFLLQIVHCKKKKKNHMSFARNYNKLIQIINKIGLRIGYKEGSLLEWKKGDLVDMCITRA